MAIPSRDEKQIMRLNRILAPLMSRRGFLMSLGVASAALVTPAEVFASIADSEAATKSAFWAFYYGAAMALDNDSTANPNDTTEDPFTDPFDGITNLTIVYTPTGPAVPPNYNGRQWFIWRVLGNFRLAFGSKDPKVKGTDPTKWKGHGPFVLKNAGLMGSYAYNTLANPGSPANPKLVSLTNVQGAFDYIKKHPTPKGACSPFFPRGGDPKQAKPFGEWCY